MMDSNTHLYAIFGNPVGHSKSPLIHNACFKHHHINAVYLAFEINEISKGISAMKTLNIKGASVTIPFKESVMDHLDWIDKDAIAIGAVNTIVNHNEKLLGFNTDFEAAVAPLNPFGIRDKNICIIGAGGAAQAVAYGIHKKKGQLVIINRNQKRGEILAQKYGADFIPLDELTQKSKINAEIIINTTSIGMYPDIENLAIPSHLIHTDMVVMDIVYTPLKTKLLLEAQKKGSTIIDGLSMFLHQGAAQFKLWTNISPEIKLMRNAVTNGER